MADKKTIPAKKVEAKAASAGASSAAAAAKPAPSSAAAAAKPAPAAAAKPTAAPGAKPASSPVAATERRRLIAEAAYFLAQKRGFAPGHDVQDWVTAERNVDATLARRG